MNLEASVISAICKTKDIMPALTAPEMDELFDSHNDIWRDVKKHYGLYREVPSVGLVSKWYEDFEAVEVEAPVQYYIDELRNAKLKAGLREIAERLAANLDADMSAASLLEKCQEKVSKLVRFGSMSRDIDLVESDGAVKHYEHLKDLAEKNGGSLGIPTGFDAIDAAYVTGMAPGHYICVIGWPGHKKSFVSEEIAIRAWAVGYKPMIISLEMTPENMRDRIYTLMAQGEFQMSQFSRASIDIENFKTWSKEHLADKHPFVIVSTEGYSAMTPDVIQGKIDQHKPDILIVDYLQLLSDNNHSKSEAERVRNVSRQLKMLAISNNIPVMAIISATREVKKDMTSPPTLDQAAWSRSIEYDADMAFAVHTYIDPSNLNNSVTEIICRKNRHGTMFDFFLNIDPENGKVEVSYDEPDWLD